MRLITGLLALLLLAGCATTAPKGEWVKVGEGWCYQTQYGCSTGPAVEPAKSDSTALKVLEVIGILGGGYFDAGSTVGAPGTAKPYGLK